MWQMLLKGMGGGMGGGMAGGGFLQKIVQSKMGGGGGGGKGLLSSIMNQKAQQQPQSKWAPITGSGMEEQGYNNYLQGGNDQNFYLSRWSPLNYGYGRK